MYAIKQIVRIFLLCVVCVTLCTARPDSGGHAPLPGPGLSYGGIPYGSVSGNVADYFNKQGLRGNLRSAGLNYAPIEQYFI